MEKAQLKTSRQNSTVFSVAHGSVVFLVVLLEEILHRYYIEEILHTRRDIRY